MAAGRGMNQYAEWFRQQLRDYNRDEPVPFAAFLFVRGRALAEFGA